MPRRDGRRHAELSPSAHSGRGMRGGAEQACCLARYFDAAADGAARARSAAAASAYMSAVFPIPRRRYFSLPARCLLFAQRARAVAAPMYDRLPADRHHR